MHFFGCILAVICFAYLQANRDHIHFFIYNIHEKFIILFSILQRHDFFFFFLIATPAVYGSSPGQGLSPSHRCDLCPRFFNPLCWARDQTLTSTSPQVATVGFLTHCIPVGTPQRYDFKCHITFHFQAKPWFI